MKKRICIALLALAMTLLLTACGSFECGICGKEKSGKRYTDEILGQEVTYCKDCHEELEKLGSGLENLTSGLEDLTSGLGDLFGK